MCSVSRLVTDTGAFPINLTRGGNEGGLESVSLIDRQILNKSSDNLKAQLSLTSLCALPSRSNFVSARYRARWFLVS